jgi:hypothetical protein
MFDALPFDEIISAYLGSRARRFVRRVAAEWDAYHSPHTHAIPGCLQRDAVRWRLVRLAYHRYQVQL